MLSAFKDWSIAEFGVKVKFPLSEDRHKIARLKGHGLRGVAQIFNRVDPVRVQDVDSLILKGKGLRIIWTSSGLTPELLSLCVKRRIKVVDSGFVFHRQSWGLKDAKSRLRVQRQKLTAWHHQYHSCSGDLAQDWNSDLKAMIWKCRRCGYYLDPIPPFAKAPYFSYNRSELSERISQEANRVRGRKKYWSLSVCLAQRIERAQGREKTLENSLEAQEIHEPCFIPLSDFTLWESDKDPPS